MVLMNCGLSRIEIQSIVKVGGSRLSRLYNFESNRNRSADRTKRTHAFNEMSVSLFQAFFSSLDVEDGFACGHRRPKMYVIGEDMTWKKLHEKYVSFVEGEKMKITDIHVRKNIKIMALTTFREYRGWLFPGHALDKKKEDVCDHCVRIQLVIDNPLTPPEEKEAAIIEKETHLDAAIDQRRAIKMYTLKYLEKLNLPVQPIKMPDTVDGDSDGEEEEARRKMTLEEYERTNSAIVDDISRIIPNITDLTGDAEDIDCLLGEEEASDNKEQATDPSNYAALVIAEDYGQGIQMPFFGLRRVQSDYFNSSLMTNLFVMADISRGENKVILYDERLMGKGKDALCSLRMKYHIENAQRCVLEGRAQPDAYISIRDNCVGQNKSNVTMQFDCFMAMSFYKRVMIIYLIPGHSHMIADRVVAWVKRSLTRKDIFIPCQLLKAVDGVKSVDATFIDHESSSRPCFEQWDTFLGKYLSKMPAGFTSNYVFEFFEGSVTMKHLISDEDDGVTVPLCDNHERTGGLMWKDLFGEARLCDVRVSDIRLPRHPIVPVDPKKLKSLGLKYHAIPEEFRDYYPQVELLPVGNKAEEVIEESPVEQSLVVTTKRKSEKVTTTPGVPKKGKVGRPPKNRMVLLAGQQTIFSMFQRQVVAQAKKTEEEIEE